MGVLERPHATQRHGAGAVTIRTHLQTRVDAVLDEHGLGRGTRLSAALVDAVADGVQSALRELAPALVADVVHGIDLSARFEDVRFSKDDPLALSTRTYNCLGRDRVHTLRDALARRAIPGVENSMHDFRNTTPRCVAEVLRAMERVGVVHPDLREARLSEWWPEDW